MRHICLYLRLKLSLEYKTDMADKFSSDKRRVAARWSEGVLRQGFTVLPNQLIKLNQFLPKDENISPTEYLVLLQLLMSWWDAGSFPFPSKATMSRQTGLSERQVQRATTRLEKRGLVKRIRRHTRTGARTSNAYDLQGLVDLLRKISGAHPERPTQDKTEKNPPPM